MNISIFSRSRFRHPADTDDEPAREHAPAQLPGPLLRPHQVRAHAIALPVTKLRQVADLHGLNRRVLRLQHVAKGSGSEPLPSAFPQRLDGSCCQLSLLVSSACLLCFIRSVSVRQGVRKAMIFQTMLFF